MKVEYQNYYLHHVGGWYAAVWMYVRLVERRKMVLACRCREPEPAGCMLASAFPFSKG
jgi:hypothetical protein